MDNQIDDHTDQIDWSDDQGLGRGWWHDQGSIAGATAQQIAFSACIHRGMTATAAARAAKYAGNTDTIRQAGLRARHSTAVETLLDMANALTGTGVEPVVNPDESKSILSKLARRSDPTTRIRALEALAKIRKDEAEMELRRQEVAPLTDIRAELREIAKISPPNWRRPTPSLRASPLTCPRFRNPRSQMMQPNSTDVIAGLTDEQRAEVAPKLTKIERTLAERQKFYLEVIEGLVWALGSAAGRATPQAKELIRFMKEIRK